MRFQVEGGLEGWRAGASGARRALEGAAANRVESARAAGSGWYSAQDSNLVAACVHHTTPRTRHDTTRHDTGAMESRGYLDELGPSSLLAELHRHATSVSACGGGGGDSGPDTGSGLDDLDDTSSWDSEEDERLAQQEWDEGIRQLQLAIQVMLCPFVGKWLGRKSSYWRK